MRIAAARWVLAFAGLVVVGASAAFAATEGGNGEAAASAGEEARTPVEIAQPPPSDFTTKITNPFFPLSLVGPKVVSGQETDPDTGETYSKRLESQLLNRTEVYDGVNVAVWEEKAYEDGELVEVALDYFAQDRAGNVWYFGEHVDNYQDGVIVNNAGQWFAGEGSNKAGVLLPAKPKVGETYQQEAAPGIAEDMIDILSVTDTVTTPAGTYTNCVKTRDYTPLEPDLEEFKWHCPGVGLARETGPGFEILLESVGATPAAEATVKPVVSPNAGPQTGVTAPNAGDGTSTGMSRDVWFAVIAVLTLVGAGGVVAGWRSVRQSR
jgi:hypothetical protein